MAVAHDTLAIAVRDLHMSFGSVHAVRGLTLHIPVGTCFALLGPNGAGKTTTVEILEGLTSPSSGSVQVLGRQWATDEPWLRQRVGVALQETQFSDKLTVRETLTLFHSFYSHGCSIAEAVDTVALHEKLDARIGTLSGGQKQRLAIACALFGEPEILFLDEPSTGLDPQSRRQVWEIITAYKQRGKTIVLTTHYMDEAELLCDDIVIMDHGQIIAQGAPKQLIAETPGARTLEDVFVAHTGRSLRD